MSGVVHQRDARVGGLLQEFPHQALHAVAVEIGAFDHIKTHLAQGFRDQTAVVGGIGQGTDVGVGAIADHERQPAF